MTGQIARDTGFRRRRSSLASLVVVIGILGSACPYGAWATGTAPEKQPEVDPAPCLAAIAANADDEVVAACGALIDNDRTAKGDRLKALLARGAVFAHEDLLDRAIADYDAALRLDPTLAVSTFDGPAAPPNHSFAGYMLEREQLDADVVVFGILASSVPKLPTLTMMTSTYEAPCVYTYPRYRLAGDELQATWPTVVSLADLRAARNDPAKWNAYVNELAANDAYYAPYLLRSTWLDHSALARIAWRALAQRHLRTVGERYHTAAGYTDDPDLLPVLRQMVATFAKTAREDGRTPVVLLFNDRGYGDDLYRGVAPVLDRDHIPYVSSHTIAPATDHQNFVADGHFTPANDEKIAKAFVDLLHTLPVPPAHR